MFEAFQHQHRRQASLDAERQGAAGDEGARAGADRRRQQHAGGIRCGVGQFHHAREEIATALRRRIPQLGLSGFYAPMVDMAQNPATSHPYAVFSASATQVPWSETGDRLLDWLARCCALRAVDQEAVNVHEHRHLAGRGLDGPLPEAT